MPFRYYPRRKKAAESPELFGAPAQAMPADRLIAHIDGGARGNPGPAGFGALIEDSAGHQVAEISKFLGHQTNNYAEYAALLSVLQYALEHGHKALEVISDSELLVKQINGQYKARHPTLLELHSQAKSLIRKLEWFKIHHVLRGKNKHADMLANRAMDEGMGRKSAPST
jgi:ribonuclease HI